MPLAGAALRRVVGSPVVRELAEMAARRLQERRQERLSVEDRRFLERAIIEDIANNPVLVNEIGAEPPTRSRTAGGGLAATVGAFGVILAMVTGEQAFDWTTLTAAIVGVWGGVTTLVGRLRVGLKPVAWWNPLTWWR